VVPARYRPGGRCAPLATRAARLGVPLRGGKDGADAANERVAALRALHGDAGRNTVARIGQHNAPLITIKQLFMSILDNLSAWLTSPEFQQQIQTQLRREAAA
jgi:hypothetical protein